MMKPVALAMVAVLALGGVGATVAPPALQHWQLHRAADDPVALSRLRLASTLTQARLTAEPDQALAARDEELAESLIALAGEHGLGVSPEQRRRLAALADGALVQAVADFGQGLFAGERESGAALAGALVGDVTGLSDMRDLAAEGQKWLGGEAADPTVLALASAGLALSLATWVSLGGTLPARSGLSVVKSASKAKLLSPALTASLGRMAAQSLDRPALNASVTAAARLDLAPARAATAGIVRPAALTRLAALGQDTGALYARAGQRGLRQTLAVAQEAGDIGRAARLAAAQQTTFRATLKLLGRGALVLGSLGMAAIGWIFAFLGYAIALAMLAQRFGWWLGRRLIPGPVRLA
jgi:hypothetical protein